MNILPPPLAVQELGTVSSQPVTGNAPSQKDGATATATASVTQASFPAVLAQANQQGGSPKATGGKDPSGNSVPLSTTQGETASEDLAIVSLEGALVVGTAPQVFPLVSPEDAHISSEHIVVLPQSSKILIEGAIAKPSPILVASEASVSVGAEPENVKSSQGVSLPPPPVTPNANNLVGEKVLPPASPPPTFQNDQHVPAPLTREPLVLELPANRLAVPSVPLSFVNPAFPQGQPLVDSVNLAKLSPVISQSTIPVPSGSSNVTVLDGLGNSNVSVVAEEGQADTEGRSLGSDQRSGQDNGSAFSSKQQASGQALAGFSFNTEAVNEFRASDVTSVGRTDTVIDRTRTMNILSTQRMQMEVMLSDESKVQLEVSVKHQQVTAQLLTDQIMLRNLALQNEPQLDAQLSSAGLELKQFGAEVSEQGVFGQHLSDSSSANSFRGGGQEGSSESELDVLVGAHAEGDGRLHYVA